MNLENIRGTIKNEVAGLSYLDMFLWALLSVVLLFALIFGFPQVIGAEEALIVQSGSMEPEIPTGSVIWIYPADYDNLKEGDIITFSSGGSEQNKQYTTHRVIEVQETEEGVQYRTEGDANEDPDPGTVSPDQIAGKHGFTAPYLGYAVVEGRNSNFFLILIGIASILLVLGELRTIYKEYMEMKKEGESRDIVQTFAVAFSLLILAIAAIRFTSYPQQLMNMAGISISTDILTGIVIMVAMLVSMIVLKFI